MSGRVNFETGLDESCERVQKILLQVLATEMPTATLRMTPVSRVASDVRFTISICERDYENGIEELMAVSNSNELQETVRAIVLGIRDDVIELGLNPSTDSLAVR